MTSKAKASILLLGATGNFGKRIAHGLAKKGHSLILCARDVKKLEALEQTLRALTPDLVIAPVISLSAQDLKALIERHGPKLVINTIGPFQEADLSLPEQALSQGVAYFDLSDGRSYVRQFTSLNGLAKAQNLPAITGVSTLPALSSAVIDHYRSEFKSLEALDFGIVPGQRTERGLSTIEAILTYVGQTLKPYAGNRHPIGWGELRSVTLPHLGHRYLSHCDVPDLDLLPKLYGLKAIRFGAGLELPIVHLCLSALSFLVRYRLMATLTPLAPLLLKLCNLFDRFGTDKGGMFMHIEGRDTKGRIKLLKWTIIASSGHGPEIPATPAIILADQYIKAPQSLPAGAYACAGLISLETYLASLGDKDIWTHFEFQYL